MNGANILYRKYFLQVKRNFFLYTRLYLHNHYDTLGLKKSATSTEIKAAFFELSKKLHPDLNPNDPKTHDKFVKLNEAYRVLSKPNTRREYDLSIQMSSHRHQSPYNYPYQHSHRSKSRTSGNYARNERSSAYGPYYRSPQSMWEAEFHHRQQKMHRYHESEFQQHQENVGKISMIIVSISMLVGGTLMFLVTLFRINGREQRIRNNNRAILYSVEKEKFDRFRKQKLEREKTENNIKFQKRFDNVDENLNGPAR